MSEPDVGATIQASGWCQGAVLDKDLESAAWGHAPDWIDRDESTSLIITSQDCDVVNPSFGKEPFVEVLAVRLRPGRKPNGLLKMGRNPRKMEVGVNWMGVERVLFANVHERWVIPRQLLLGGPPVLRLDDDDCHLLANWLAKRYIRASFPSEFDRRWKSKVGEWEALLTAHSGSILGVYIRVSTMEELEASVPYRCEMIVAVHSRVREGADWSAVHDEVRDGVNAFWGQFHPGIKWDGVMVRGPADVSLQSIQEFQRFDVDWISVEDDTGVVPTVIALQ